MYSSMGDDTPEVTPLSTPLRSPHNTALGLLGDCTCNGSRPQQSLTLTPKLHTPGLVVQKHRAPDLHLDSTAEARLRSITWKDRVCNTNVLVRRFDVTPYAPTRQLEDANLKQSKIAAN